MEMTVWVKILLFIWELPQNIIGWIISCFSNYKEIDYKFLDGKTGCFYYHKLNPKTFGEAVTLGEYIIVDEGYISYTKSEMENLLNHEYGHVKQSRILGWFYLLIIGLPSLIHAAIHDNHCTDKNYKHFYTEKWADKLGKVNA